MTDSLAARRQDLKDKFCHEGQYDLAEWETLKADFEEANRPAGAADLDQHRQGYGIMHAAKRLVPHG